MKKKKDIQDELKSLSPFLSEKDKERKGGFKVPEGYFESLTDRVVNRAETAGNSKEELLELSPLLAEKFKHRQGGLTAPKDYFDNLADRLEQNAKPQAKVKSIGNVWMRRMVAASVLLFIVAGLWFIVPQSEQGSLAQLEQLSEAEVLQYLDQNMSEFEFGDLLESGIVSNDEIDFYEVAELSTEEQDLYIDSILEEEDLEM